jgi:hypothetical protein
MKKFVGIVFLVLVFVGCDLGTGGSDKEKFVLTDLKVKNTDVKSLYVSNVPVSSARAVNNISTIQTISYISEGQNTPFAFTTPSGKNIVLEVSSLRQLDDKRIEVWFGSYYEITINDNTYTIVDSVNLGEGLSYLVTKSALIDIEKNKVYDVTNWNIQMIDKDTMYASSRYSIMYKIDLNNISIATPLNNNSYYSIGGIYPAFLFGNKILSSPYVIDINNAFPIKDIQDGYITADMCSFIPESDPCKVDFYYDKTGLILQDFSGGCWFIVFGGKTPGITNKYGLPTSGYGQNDKYFIGKVSIDDEGKIFLSDYYEDTFSFTQSNDYAMFFMNSAGGGSTIGSIHSAKKSIIIYDMDLLVSVRKPMEYR